MQASGGRRSCVPTGKYDGSISAPPLGLGPRPAAAMARRHGTIRRVLRCRVAARTTTISLGARRPAPAHALTNPLRVQSQQQQPGALLRFRSCLNKRKGSLA